MAQDDQPLSGSDESPPTEVGDDAAGAEQRSPADEQELSLDQLTEAFAEMLGVSPDRPPAAAPGEEPAADDETDAAAARFEPAADADPDGDVEVSPASILEAMLFVGSPDNRPLESKQIAALIRGVEPAEVDELVHGLNARYAQDNCPYAIVREGSGYRMVLREEFHRLRDKFYGRRRQVQLSQAAIEVLAVVAYNQPITAEELQTRRGTGSGAILSQLVRRGLLRFERAEKKPRPARYFTTDRFLQLFNLRSLDELPRSQDLDRQ